MWHARKRPGEPAVKPAEIAALREQLCAAQGGAEAAYRSALAWVAHRAEAQAMACGGRSDAVIEAALLLVHALRHTYDPARDPVVWVDALIARAAMRASAAPARPSWPAAMMSFASRGSGGP